MKRSIFASKWIKIAGLLTAGAVFGILPSGCETMILRFATPFLL